MALLQQVIHVEKLEQENNRVPASTFLNIDASWFLEKGTLKKGRRGYFKNRKKRVPRNRYRVSLKKGTFSIFILFLF